jgi:tetratricopeptide (TPR) repeat protein
MTLRTFAAGTAAALLAGTLATGAGVPWALAAAPPNPPLYAPSAYQGAAHLRHYEALAKSNPRNLIDQFEAAVAAFQNRQPKQAIAYYEACLRIDPHFGEAANDIGNVYREELGNTKQALAYYQRATRLSPGYGPAWLNIGLLYQGKGQTAAAVAAFVGGTKAAPTYDGNWLSLVSLYVTKHDTKLARQYAQAALKALPTTDPARAYLEKVARGKGSR